MVCQRTAEVVAILFLQPPSRANVSGLAVTESKSLERYFFLSFFLLIYIFWHSIYRESNSRAQNPTLSEKYFHFLFSTCHAAYSHTPKRLLTFSFVIFSSFFLLVFFLCLLSILYRVVGLLYGIRSSLLTFVFTACACMWQSSSCLQDPRGKRKLFSLLLANTEPSSAYRRGISSLLSVSSHQRECVMQTWDHRSA